MMKRRITRLEQILKQTSGACNEEYARAMNRLTESTRNRLLHMMSQYIEGLESEALNEAQVKADKELVEEYEKIHGIVHAHDGSQERIEQKLRTIRIRTMPEA
ncbi:MAG TPA: hypothetical protein VIK34_06800 [Clostridiaceae bacterium]